MTKRRFFRDFETTFTLKFPNIDVKHQPFTKIAGEEINAVIKGAKTLDEAL